MQIRAAGPDDAQVAAAILTESFVADPVMGWAFADQVRERRLRAMWTLLAEDAYLPVGDSMIATDATGEGAAAALWARSDRLPGDAFWNEHGPRLVEELDGDTARLDVVSDSMAAQHPSEPHWYLLAIGVRARLQGQGVGSALATPTLAAADADGIGCYLEATSARSRDLYLRWGFEVTEEFGAEGCPPLWAMWRSPEGTGAGGVLDPAT